jgi:predicted tellurium resistance membrane protein TerC
MTRTILLSIALIAFTDVALQLDNALAISSVASTVPPSTRVVVLAGGVLLAALCLFTFTFIGSMLIERIGWLKPVAGLALFVIGGKLIYDYFRPLS